LLKLKNKMISIFQNKPHDITTHNISNPQKILDIVDNGKLDIQGKVRSSCIILNGVNKNANLKQCCSNCQNPSKNKKPKAKDITPEQILEMQELRQKLGVSFLGLSKLYGLTRHVVVHALSNYEQDQKSIHDSNNDETTVKLSNIGIEDSVVNDNEKITANMIDSYALLMDISGARSNNQRNEPTLDENEKNPAKLIVSNEKLMDISVAMSINRRNEPILDQRVPL
jgi:hypothetical protein